MNYMIFLILHVIINSPSVVAQNTTEQHIDYFELKLFEKQPM